MADHGSSGENATELIPPERPSSRRNNLPVAASKKALPLRTIRQSGEKTEAPPLGRKRRISLPVVVFHNRTKSSIPLASADRLSGENAPTQ